MDFTTSKESGGRYPVWEAVKSFRDLRSNHFPKKVRSASYTVCRAAARMVRAACSVRHFLNFKKMFNLIFALFMAFACPAPTHPKHNNNSTTVVIAAADSGGDQEHLPPPPPPPPPVQN